MAPEVQTVVHRALVRGLVQLQIFCPRTGQVLDVRTCVVINDTDGDPKFVMSQDGWAQVNNEQTRAVLARSGYSVDESTVKS